MTNPFLEDGVSISIRRAGPVSHRVRAPGSKSLTNRYLLLASLANGVSRIENPLTSDDTRYMSHALKQLGAELETGPEAWTVTGRLPWRNPGEPIFVGNAGTVMRFLSPALALGDETVTITGNKRMAARPIADLTDGLRQLGATVSYPGREGYPPLAIRGPIEPGPVRIKADASSQYLSGLLMVLPLLSGPSRIEISGALVSRTYVAMTLDCMAKMGVDVHANQRFTVFDIAGSQQYKPHHLVIEPDASTASYWFALPMMVGGSIEVEDVPETSHQGDFGFLAILAKMGAAISRIGDGVRVAAGPIHGVDVDMNTMSDVAPTLAVVATMAKTPTTIRNIGNMRIKECDRIATLQTGFDALGLRMSSGPDWMRIEPGRPTREALLDPEDDHRMAMVFTLLGLAFGGVQIRDPACVAKTYPAFFEAFARAWP